MTRCAPAMSAYRSKADIKTRLYECPLLAEAVEELYFSLGQNIYSHLSDIHSNRYERGIAKYLKSSSGSSYEPMWRQRNALFKMTASGRKMSIFKIRSSSTASANSGRSYSRVLMSALERKADSHSFFDSPTHKSIRGGVGRFSNDGQKTPARVWRRYLF